MTPHVEGTADSQFGTNSYLVLDEDTHDAVIVDEAQSLERGVLTARGYDRVLRLAWTLADLGHRDKPDTNDIGQALGLRRAAAAMA